MGRLCARHKSGALDMAPKPLGANAPGQPLTWGALHVARLRLSPGRALLGAADRSIVIEPSRVNAGVDGGVVLAEIAKAPRGGGLSAGVPGPAARH